MRLEVRRMDADLDAIEPRQARLKPNGRAKLFNADATVLSHDAGVDAAAALISHGARAVGSRADLFHDTGPAAARWAAAVPRGATQPVAVAYCLTRVLPVFDASQPDLRLLNAGSPCRV
jgi:hypothetical protein